MSANFPLKVIHFSSCGHLHAIGKTKGDYQYSGWGRRTELISVNYTFTRNGIYLSDSECTGTAHRFHRGPCLSVCNFPKLSLESTFGKVFLSSTAKDNFAICRMKVARFSWKKVSALHCFTLQLNLSFLTFQLRNKSLHS